MPCYHPIQAFRSADGLVTFVERGGRDSRSLLLPCGRCVGCRLERSRQWAIRCVHEASLWPRNSFVTLTYAPEHVPPGMSLRYRDFQLFMKRLRKRLAGWKVRFYMCGEYGEDFSRPHYHACLFNLDFPDKVLWKKTSAGSRIFRSAMLEELWPFGHSSIGEVNFQTAAYTARYVMKKMTGDLADDHYRWVDPVTGECFDREPEFCRMSLKPGIGAGWIEKFASDVFPHGRVVANGKEVMPPKYYDRWFKRASRRSDDRVSDYEEMISQREIDMYEFRADGSESRLGVREQVTQARLAHFSRSLK